MCNSTVCHNFVKLKLFPVEIYITITEKSELHGMEFSNICMFITYSQQSVGPDLHANTPSIMTMKYRLVAHFFFFFLGDVVVLLRIIESTLSPIRDKLINSVFFSTFFSYRSGHR